MKKNILITLVSVITLTLAFQSCGKSRTYADMLAKERKAVHKYIDKNKIKIISLEEFEKDTITDLEANEFANLGNGLYMQIVRRGSENPVDTFASRDEITARFSEYNMIDEFLTSATNTSASGYVDTFVYTIEKEYVTGLFSEGGMLALYGPQVPTGWLLALKYLRHDSSVKLIVPSKMGHTAAFQEVYPYVYDIKRFDIVK